MSQAVLPSEEAIRSRPCPNCYLCGREGRVLYTQVPDRLFGAPGSWSFRQCPDPSCRLVWIDPMPLPDEIGKAYRTYHTHTTDEPVAPLDIGHRVYRWIRDGYVSRRYGYPAPRWQRWLSPFMYVHPGARAHADFGVWYQPAPAPGTRLLDVGCGSGGGLAHMRELGWSDVEGVEIDEEAAQAGRQRGLRIRLGTLQSQGYAPSSFDVITMSHVIEHVHEPVDLLRECHRILKPGGQLLVATPNTRSRGHRRFRDAWRGLEPPRHLFLFSPGNLGAALAQSAEWAVDALTTTVHGAGLIWMVSEEISVHGQVRRGRRRRVLEQLKAHTFYYMEAARLLFDRQAGEEILVIAVKRS